MSARYRYRLDLCEIEASFVPSVAGGNWVVRDRIRGGQQVLTEDEFRARFEHVPDLLWPHNRTCVSCRHRVIEPPTVEHSVCRNPKVGLSLVSGEVKKRYPCRVGRLDKGLCGRCGIHCEPVDAESEAG